MEDVLKKYHRRMVEVERMHRVEEQRNVLILLSQFRLLHR